MKLIPLEILEDMVADGRLTARAADAHLRFFGLPPAFADPPLPKPMPDVGAGKEPRLEFYVRRAESGQRIFHGQDAGPDADDQIGQKVTRSGGNHSQIEVGDAQTPLEEPEDEVDDIMHLWADKAARRSLCKP